MDSELLQVRLEEAQAAYSRGWALTPLVGKKPVLKAWTSLPFPSFGEVEAWARSGNLGLRTGSISGVVAIDFDTAKGAQIQSVFQTRPQTPTVITGNDGLHVYLQTPEAGLGNSVSKIAPHVDIRGDGGQVVFVGSIHPETGRPYRWSDGLSPDDVSLAPFPDDLFERLTKQRHKPVLKGQTTRLSTEIISPYGQVALERETERVRHAEVGSRNDTLNRSAFFLGQLVGGGELLRATVEQALIDACNHNGLVADDGERSVLATLRSGLETGRASPRGVPERPDGRSSGTSSPESVPHTVDYHRTDTGNVDRFVRDHGKNVRFVHTWGKWLVWTGRHWQVDETGAAMRLARDTVILIYHEAGHATEDGERKRLIKHALTSESRTRLEAIVKLAKSHEAVAITHKVLDQDPWLLSVRNGTLNLRSGELRIHRREDLITKCLPVTYEPGEECPLWEEFLERIFDGDHDLIDYIQRAVGYTLTGLIMEQALFLLHGTGANGKSTFLETIRAFLEDYAKQTPFDTFLVSRDGGIPNDIARLCGARMVTACEADTGKRMSESLVKSLTGGDRITARFMRAEFFEYDPEFKIWLATNHKPAVWGVDHAIWRRIKLIPFTVTIPDEEQDKDLVQRLRQELPGILRWAVEGCLRWQKKGLGEAKAVTEATSEYRNDEDILAEFIEERCILSPGLSARVSDLFKEYRTWAEDTGATVLTKKRLGCYLKERPEGLQGDRESGQRVWRGIGLRTRETHHEC